MSAQHDEQQAFALGLVLAIVALVVASVVALAVLKSHAAHHAPVAASTEQRIMFAAGQDRLTVSASEVLSGLADAARTNRTSMLVVSGVFGAGVSIELAHRRALQVRHALQANGVAPGQISLTPPMRRNRHHTPGAEQGVDVRVQ